MQTRRTFLQAAPIAGASLVTGCATQANAATQPPVASVSRSPSSSPATTPATVIVEDWSSGAAVDVGRIDFASQVRTDSFADPLLAADCKSWVEHGPDSKAVLPVLNGVQFSAKRFTIAAGGQYKQQSFRVLVMMRALGLRDGLYGDPRGVQTYPGAHKLRILSMTGTVMKIIEMRDGLPMNDPSLCNNPYDYTVVSRGADPTALGNFPNLTMNYTSRLPASKPMRPMMSAGSSYVAFFGDTPNSSTAVRNRIPRVKADSWHMKGTMYRAVYNGDDMHLYDPDVGGNGNAHPEVMPRWAMSRLAITNMGAVINKNPYLLGANAGYNWANALRVGWDYEPGALGGITRRGGPGGTRIDRTVLPQEILQMGLAQTKRLNDDQPTADMARGFVLNHANYPGYYPRSMTTLDAINQFDPTPQPTVPGGASVPVIHYYGGVNTALAAQPGAIWLVDQYGSGGGSMASAVEWYAPGKGTVRGNGMHPRNGWCPDSEHNNRTGTAWAALMYADPMFSRMAEHMMMFESNLMSPVLIKGWNVYGEPPASCITDAGGMWWSQRTNVLPFCTATMMWWVATNNGVYTRKQIETRIHAFFAQWKADIRDKLPSTAAATTPGQRAFGLTGGLSVTWQTWTDAGNMETDSGWVAWNGLGKAYCGQWLTLLKTSGLYDVLMQNPTTALCLGDLVRQQEFNARMFVGAPWALMNVNTSPYIILRKASKGAVQNDLKTIPSTIAEALSYNPSPRGDSYWFLRAGDTPGVSTYAIDHDPSGFTRIQSAKGWWDMYAAAGTERTAAKAAIDARMAVIRDYSPLVYNPGFVRFNSPQTVPDFEA